MFVAAIYHALKRYVHYRVQLVCIDQLDERILHDIGISRDELHSQAWHRADVATY
jgi:uncharacterized protein YjiS (DUF1127 family)